MGDKRHSAVKVVIFLVVVSMLMSTGSALINTTQILDGFNAIWAMVDNIADNFGSILTLVIFGTVIAITYIFRDFIQDMFKGITKNTK